MTVPAINQFKINNNIQFTGNQSDKKEGSSKTEKIVKGTLAAAGLATLGVVGYKNNWVQKGIKKLSECGFMKNKVFPNYEKGNANFMALIGVMSIVLKDGFGCYLYVKQSLNNKEIPEDKRKFVAALDLANGGLMVAMQLLMFFTISNKKVQDKIFNGFFGKNFTRTANKALKAKLHQQEKLAGMTGKEFYKARAADLKGLKDAFGYLISLAAATLFAKRVVVPFIATPLADKTKAWMCRNDKPVQTHKDTKNTYCTEPEEDKKNTTPKFSGKTENKETNLLKQIKDAQ